MHSTIGLDMRKSICVWIIILFASLSLSFAGNSAVLHLNACVPNHVAISIVSTPFASKINILQDPQDELLGTVIEMSNSLDGYLVYVSSDNATAELSSMALLKQGEDLTIPYYITYGGAPVEFSNGAAKVTDHIGLPDSGLTAEKEVRLVFIDSSGNIAPGSYSDTLTFTIAAR